MPVAVPRYRSLKYPTPAKSIDTPARTKAIGNPVKRRAIKHTNIRITRR
jgi:hypothetical protein